MALINDSVISDILSLNALDGQNNHTQSLHLIGEISTHNFKFLMIIEAHTISLSHPCWKNLSSPSELTSFRVYTGRVVVDIFWYLNFIVLK